MAAIRNYTPVYTRIDAGFMGQLAEWPEVITEGRDVTECRRMLEDALKEMELAYRAMGKKIPSSNAGTS